MSPGAIAAVFPSVLGYRFSLLARIAGLTYLCWPIGIAYLLVTIKTQDEMQRAIWRVAGAGGGIPPASVAYQLELATTAGPAKETRIFGLGDWIGGRYRDGMLAHITGVWSKRKDFTASLVVTLVAAAALLLFEPHIKRLGVEVRLWSASYLVYLLLVFFPQSSIFRLLVPLSPLWGAIALPRSTAWRCGVLAAGLVGQWWWIYNMYALGNTLWQIP